MRSVTVLLVLSVSTLRVFLDDCSFLIGNNKIRGNVRGDIKKASAIINI